MARTLEDMKRDRGGLCHNCGKDIMGTDEKDHTFCNNCWYDMLKHPFELEDGDPLCAQCGEDENSPYHTKYMESKQVDYLTKKWARITGI